MIVSINQPAYLPWLGYFHRIAVSDVHVILDHVQIGHRSFTNRNRIRTKEGSLMLTIPIKTKGLFGKLAINTIEIAGDKWKAKHFKSIEAAYAKSKYFKLYIPVLNEFFSRPVTKLIDFITPINEWLLNELNIQTKMIKSSEMKIEGVKSDLILDICQSLHATTYLSGPLGRDYLNRSAFSEAGIKVEFHDYSHPVYRQGFEGFQPYMTVLDLLFNHGPETMNIINYSDAKFVSE